MGSGGSVRRAARCVTNQLGDGPVFPACNLAARLLEKIALWPEPRAQRIPAAPWAHRFINAKGGGAGQSGYAGSEPLPIGRVGACVRPKKSHAAPNNSFSVVEEQRFLYG
jgi:hypothetical protein